MDTRRWPRFPFIAIVIATDPRSMVAMTARTSDLSLGGCYIDSVNPPPSGATITVELVHKARSFHAVGRVVYSEPNMGAGISFEEISKEDREILIQWIEELKLAQTTA
jgi:hypothetical protein